MRGRARARRGVLTLALLAAVACANGEHAQPLEPVECVVVRTASIRLSADAACTVAHDGLAERLLPDLEFSPGLCFTTGAVDAEVTAPDGRVLQVSATVYSGIDTNVVTGTGLAPFPVPLIDSQGVAHVYIPITAASLIEVRSKSRVELLGALVTRDAGYAEIDAASALPSFVSERLAITGGDGVFVEAVGEFIATGDEFGAGSPAIGSLCGQGLIDNLWARGE